MRFAGNNVRHENFRTSGVPYVMVARGGRMTIGKNFAMNNGAKGNPIGCFQPCTLWVDRGAEILIGDNVGISQTALISHCRIEVQSNVKIGGVLAYIPQISTRLMPPSVPPLPTKATVYAALSSFAMVHSSVLTASF